MRKIKNIWQKDHIEAQLFSDAGFPNIMIVSIIQRKVISPTSVPTYIENAAETLHFSLEGLRIQGPCKLWYIDHNIIYFNCEKMKLSQPLVILSTVIILKHSLQHIPVYCRGKSWVECKIWNRKWEMGSVRYQCTHSTVIGIVIGTLIGTLIGWRWRWREDSSSTSSFLMST